eukprot:403357919
MEEDLHNSHEDNNDQYRNYQSNPDEVDSNSNINQQLPQNHQSSSTINKKSISSQEQINIQTQLQYSQANNANDDEMHDSDQNNYDQKSNNQLDEIEEQALLEDEVGDSTLKLMTYNQQFFNNDQQHVHNRTHDYSEEHKQDLIKNDNQDEVNNNHDQNIRSQDLPFNSKQQTPSNKSLINQNNSNQEMQSNKQEYAIEEKDQNQDDNVKLTLQNQKSAIEDKNQAFLSQDQHKEQHNHQHHHNHNEIGKIKSPYSSNNHSNFPDQQLQDPQKTFESQDNKSEDMSSDSDFSQNEVLYQDNNNKANATHKMDESMMFDSSHALQNQQKQKRMSKESSFKYPKANQRQLADKAKYTSAFLDSGKIQNQSNSMHMKYSNLEGGSNNKLSSPNQSKAKINKSGSKQQAEKLKVKLKQTGRCGICTLLPPCKHTEALERQLREQQMLIQQQEELAIKLSLEAPEQPDSPHKMINVGQFSSINNSLSPTADRRSSPSNHNKNKQSVDGGNSVKHISPTKLNLAQINQTHQPEQNQQHSNSIIHPTSQYAKTLHLFGTKNPRSSYHHGQDISSRLSPYSILRTSREIDLEEEFQKMSGMGFKNTRAQILKQMHLKKQFIENPNLSRYPRSKNHNDSVNTSQYLPNDNPHQAFQLQTISQPNNFNTIQGDNKRLNQSVEMRSGYLQDLQNNQRNSQQNSLQTTQVRIRNRRGQYESVDGSLHQQLNMNRTNKDFGENGQNNDDQMKFAEQRLRVIEQISRFREEKIKKEFLKLEDELKKEEERIKNEKDKEERRRQHMLDARKRLNEYQKIKEEKDQQERERQKQMRQSIKLQQLQIMKYNEDLKQKIKDYRQKSLAQGSMANIDISHISSNSKERNSSSPNTVHSHQQNSRYLKDDPMVKSKNYHIRIDKQKWQYGPESIRNSKERVNDPYPKLNNKEQAYGIYTQSLRLKESIQWSKNHSQGKGKFQKKQIVYAPLSEQLASVKHQSNMSQNENVSQSFSIGKSRLQNNGLDNNLNENQNTISYDQTLDDEQFYNQEPINLEIIRQEQNSAQQEKRANKRDMQTI